MISNNSSGKLKASKSSKDLDYEVADDPENNPSGRVVARSRPNINSNESRLHSSVVYSQKDGRIKPRSKNVNEFREFRGQPSERRGAGRARGGFGGKNDRYSSESTYRRFQEPLTKQNIGDSNANVSFTYANSKFDSDALMKSNFVYALPEDTRISKLLRRLCGETDVEKSLSICAKLQEAIMLPDNVRYIRRSYDILADSLLEVLYDAPSSETKGQVSASLGRIGYVMGPEYKKHQDWVMGRFSIQRNDEVKAMLILSFSHLFLLDAEKPSLGDHVTTAMTQLQSVIEATDSAKIFTVAIEAIVTLSKSYPDAFAKHFIDMVDILVGWHVDAAQSRKVKEFALGTLGEFSSHWRADLVFSVKLLGQFLEDMLAYGEELTQLTSGHLSDQDEPSASPEECVQRITSFINVFNTVAKSLGEMLNPNMSSSISWTFLTDSYSKMIRTYLGTLKINFNDELIVAGNECTYLFLAYLQTKVSSNFSLLYELISLQLNNCSPMSDEATISLLNLVRKTIKEISGNLPIEFIKTIIGRDSNLLKLRISHNHIIREAVISVYQGLLNLKNIPLLQDAYKYVLRDLELAYRMLVPGTEILSSDTPTVPTICSESEVEMIILFNLHCLTDIANASNSIIGMWALQPTILELLAVKLRPYDQKLAFDNPLVQYSVIYLLYSHCKKNNHFIASSDLISYGQPRSNMCDIYGLSNISLGEVSNVSPTSGHFGVIVTLFNKLFKCKLQTDTLILLLNWTNDIFIQLRKYFPAGLNSKLLLELVMNIIETGFSINERIVEGVALNMNTLMDHCSVPWNDSIMVKLGELCLIHLDNNNNSIKLKYATLIPFVPWDIIILDLIRSSDVKTEKYRASKSLLLDKTNIVSTQKEHLMRDTCGQMSTQQFKKFMSYLLNAISYKDGWLPDAFINCWPLKNAEGNDTHITFFRQCSQHFASVLSMWATWESARLCITQKLRTPIGKPQETFTHIETAIKQLARKLTSCNLTSIDSKEIGEIDKGPVSELRRSRLLIEFLECLEKAIHNAAEGCATVMVPVIPAVRTFFHTNNSTCREWLSRVRPAALVVGLHAGHASAVIRHAHSLLLTSTHSPTSPNSATTLSADVLTYCLSLARALIQLKESEALTGLYTWTKKNYHVKVPWLKAAADQSAKRYELAIESYYFILCQIPNEVKPAEGETPKVEAVYVLDELEKQFINDQIQECYRNIQCWSDLKNWMEREKNTLSETPHEEIINQSIEMSCLDKFANEEIIFPQEFCDWDNWITDSQMSKQEWSCFNLLDKTESRLKNAAFNVLLHPDSVPNAAQTIEECSDILQASLHELSRNQPCEFLSNIHILHYAASGLKRMINDGKLLMNPFFSSLGHSTLKNVDPSTMSKIIWWSDYFLKINSSEIELNIVESMRLDLVKSSRKHSNVNASKRELIKYYSTFKHHFLPDASIKQLEDVYDLFVGSTNSYDMNMWTLNNVTAIMETSKLLYLQDGTREMAINLCASASLGVSQRLTLAEHTYEFREKGTRMLLTLSKWVQNENDKLLINNLRSPLTKLVTALPEIGLVNNNVSANVIPISDSAVGKLLQFSVNQCPGLAKAWFTFGSWCFRWGRKMVEYSSKIGGQLTENDKLQIQSVMLLGSPEDFETICEILSKTRVNCDDEDIDWNQINTSEMIESQLRSVTSLRNAYPEHLVLLVDIWRQAQKRVFSYYELSADAYFKFLELSSASENVNHNGECAIVTATLRLLRLIVKHAMELQNVLESGLANTPTHPWKVIIPQLFSRLNHPENYVRRRVSELLCRLAEDTPHLITFPAVVGAEENEKINLADISFPKSSIIMDAENIEICTGDSADNSDAESEKDNDLNSCFMDMVDTLSKQAPETILQVQRLVKELRRINLLWDELWLGTLAQHHSEITRRLAQLDMEILKVKNNVTLQQDEKEKLICEKHRIILKPILYVLEQLADITSATPETPHEESFQEKFLDSIKSMLDKLRNPSDPDKPKESWLPIKELQIKLQQKSSKRSSYMLKMSDISPTLARMTDTVISMPGVHTSSNVRITIMAISNTVAILPTKTKPKKLIFHGSDGKTYTYLFKGLEDLHLDERIMQFLSIMNTMLAHDKEDSCDQTYRARHYSVIPLGPRSGLISWVDNLTPLFALYKRWQQRESATMSAKNNKFVTVLRPSELFYNKLTPLLNAAGINTENRKEWPVGILKKVLTELMAETPKDLLAKELWCGSVTPGQWWRTVRRYSFSVAVMSTIGYIIGLGDRHLDNVLVDLSTGELVHIDYNVCFEKGKTLRVPEKVPFRMTPNLEHALGVTGVEGIFRLASEHVLKTAKRGRETLLTLLEAFVYDPLVEWGGGAGAGGPAVPHAAPGGASGARGRRARLEMRCARDMLVVRVAEVRHDWNDNREEILKQIAVTARNATNWIEHLRALTLAEGRLQHDHRQMALVKELEALGPDLSEHPLFSAAQRYTAYKQMRDALDESAKNLVDLYEDCGIKTECYTRAMETIKGPQLTQWIQELNFPIDQDGHLVFDLIRDFLLNAGQSSMIAQCEQSETELGQIARQQTTLIKSCLELLNQYSAVVQYYPQSFIEKHRIVLYRKWAGILLETDSPDVCREVINQIQNYLNSDNVTHPSVQQAVTFSYKLQANHNDANVKLKKLYERIQVEGGQEALSRCENSLLDAKSTISGFIMQENGADKAMECVTITALCALNKRYLMLESGALSAGDCLVDLTSRDGEWFFDDMSIISSLITEFISFIPLHHSASTKNDDRIPLALDCLKATKSIFVDLQELSYNFQMIILPEAVKKIQSEEPSVLLMINELNTVVLGTACPLNDLLTQLEMHLRYIIMEMESPAANAQIIAADLRQRYESLVGCSDPPTSVPSAGRMLLMGSDGLFKPLMGRGSAVLDALAALHLPHVWRKIDQIGEAKDLAAPLHNEQLRSVLEDIFFIKRIQALTEFFSLCVQMSCAFKGVGAPTIHDDDRLYKPIKRFIADYIRRQFLGVQSQCVGVTICLLMQRLGLSVNMEIEQRDIGVSWKVPLEELSELCIGYAIKAGVVSASNLQQANALNANLETAFRRREAMRMLERTIDTLAASAARLRLQTTAHGWLRAEGRPNNAGVPLPPSPGAMLPPAPPAAELRRAAQQLAALQPRIAAALEKHRALVASAEQRLKWATGANPALMEVMAAFECAVNIREDRLGVERALAQAVGATCGALGGAAELTGGRGLPMLANRRRHALALLARAAPAPAPLHEALLQLLTPENGIDAFWVNNVSALLTDMIGQLQKHIGDLKNNLAASEETLKTSANKLANSRNIHERLIFDAKGLLKSLSKNQEAMGAKVEDYLSRHEAYMGDMTKLIDSLCADFLTEDEISVAIVLSSKLEQDTTDIYSDLISFENGWNEDGSLMKRRGTLVRQVAGNWSSPARQTTPPKSRVIQQQNAYAASVWKRVRLKLEGRDPDPARKHSNQEQVEYIMNEAMSLDNLCLLYEGWTPWV